MTTGDKRYPTRMHEVLGVETNELFAIKGCEGQFYLNDSGNFWFVRDFDKRTTNDVNPYTITRAVNYGITRRPRLTEEQVKQLRALVVLGKSWISKDKDGSVFAFKNKPERDENKAMWIDRLYEYAWFLPGTSALADLVSWSDPEPLDIVATLKAAGVEVEK